MTDHQGTVLATTDSTGAIVSTEDYRPFGAKALGAPATGPGYTGHVADDDSELTYMQARYYDPVVGRFISPDPLDLAAGTGFTFNRYTYVSNNPTSLVDPTGLFAENMSAQQIQCEVFHCENSGPGDSARAERGMRAAGLANSALAASSIAGTAYNAAAVLATAWSDVVAPIGKRLQVEIGSDILFRTGRGFWASAAYSSGDRNTIDFNFLRGLSSREKEGEIHTHPDNKGFSGMTAVGMPFERLARVSGTNGDGDLRRYLLERINGYVALPNGAIYGWQYAPVRNRIDHSGWETLGDSVITIRKGR